MKLSKEELLARVDVLSKGFGSLVGVQREAFLDSSSDNGKHIRWYNQAEALFVTGIHARNIKRACTECEINPLTGSKWSIRLEDVFKLYQWKDGDAFRRSEEQAVQIVVVSNLKGGAGKTTVAATMAMAMAVELRHRYRVGFIDLDPQGTGTMFFKPNLSEDDICVGDLMQEKFTYEEGETFDSVCKGAFYPTHAPNLKVLCCRESCRDYDDKATLEQCNGQGGERRLDAANDLRRIIKAVEGEFDIIFVDTAPHFSPLTIAGHSIASTVLVPLRASENDIDSTARYFNFMMNNMMPLFVGADDKGLDSIKVLVTAVSASSQVHSRVADEIRHACGFGRVFANEFIQSDAVTVCAEDVCTIFCMSVSEYPKTKVSLRNAQGAVMKLVYELDRDFRENWGIA